MKEGRGRRCFYGELRHAQYHRAGNCKKHHRSHPAFRAPDIESRRHHSRPEALLLRAEMAGSQFPSTTPLVTTLFPLVAKMRRSVLSLFAARNVAPLTNEKHCTCATSTATGKVRGTTRIRHRWTVFKLLRISRTSVHRLSSLSTALLSPKPSPHLDRGVRKVSERSRHSGCGRGKIWFRINSSRPACLRSCIWEWEDRLMQT